MRGSGKYGRGAKSLSLAEALYGNKGRNKESPPLLEIDLPQKESTPSPAAHGEEDLRLELGEALARFSRIQADFYCGLASVGDFNEAKYRVGELRNQLGLNPELPMLSTAIGRPKWISQPKLEE